MSGEDEASHFRLLEEVFAPLERHGLCFKHEKCQFLLLKVEYLGHQISSDGIDVHVQPLLTKVDAIVKAPVTEMYSNYDHSYVIIPREQLHTNYYGKFIPN